MTLYKTVNGEDIVLTQAEEDAYNAMQPSEENILQSHNRKESIYSPVEYNNSIFTNSEVAGSNLDYAERKIPEPIAWIDISGNSISLTKAQAADIMNLMMIKRSAGYFQEATLITQIMACTSESQLDAIDITFS